MDSIQDDREHGVYPDVRVVERRPRSSSPVLPAASGVVVAEPFIIHVDDETHTEGYLQIIDTAQGGRVVTVLEILKYSNKRKGRAQDEYRQKQAELRERGVNLVEIDLLRGGRRVLQVSDFDLPPEQRAAYAACVHRSHRKGVFEYYAMPLRAPLPTIAIPLRSSDADVLLNIQSLVDQAYADGAYDDLDYSQPPVPPLAEEDAEWAKMILAAARKNADESEPRL